MISVYGTDFNWHKHNQFTTIQLPLGIFLTYYVARLEARGDAADPLEFAA